MSSALTKISEIIFVENKKKVCLTINMTMITKTFLRKHYKTDAEIARLFGISRAAVSQWRNDRPIPRDKMLELKYELRPDLFIL